MTSKAVCLVICDGIHSPRETEGILAMVDQDSRLSQLPIQHFSPGSPLTVLSGAALRRWLEGDGRPTGENNPDYPCLIIWAFSAGCVGAVALAQHWQRYRGGVLALFLVDGWGVPAVGPMPLHRLSHDRFTHVSSGWLGPGSISFVSQPAVSHHQLWRHPQQVWGYQVRHHPSRKPTVGCAMQPERLTAGDFLCRWSRYYLIQGLGGAPDTP